MFDKIKQKIEMSIVILAFNNGKRSEQKKIKELKNVIEDLKNENKLLRENAGEAVTKTVLENIDLKNKNTELEKMCLDERETRFKLHKEYMELLDKNIKPSVEDIII